MPLYLVRLNFKVFKMVDRDLDLIGGDILTLTDTYTTIKKYGLNKTSLSLVKHLNLLSESSILGLESSGTHLDITIALEDIKEKIKESVSKWSEKLASFIKNSSSKITGTITSLMDRMKTAMSSVKTKIFENVDSAKNYARVHPYKTLAKALTAALATMAVLGFVIKGLPSLKTPDNLNPFMSKIYDMINKIDWPFGKIAANLSNRGNRISVAIAGITLAAGTGIITKLGYTRAGLDFLGNSLSRIGGNLRSMWPDIQNKSSEIFSGLKTITSGMGYAYKKGEAVGSQTNDDYRYKSPVVRATVTAGTISLTVLSVAVVSIGYVMFKLITSVVIGTIKLFCATLNKLIGSSPKHNGYV